MSKEHTYAIVLGPNGEIIAKSKMDDKEAYSFLKPYRVEHVAIEATTSITQLYRRLVDVGEGAADGHEPPVGEPGQLNSAVDRD